MDHVVGSLHILLVEKEGRIWFRITCWCLTVLESVMEFALQSVLKYVMLEENSKKVMARHVGLHVDFSSRKSSLGLQAFTFVFEVNLDGLQSFNQ